ncbi:cytochrome c biogenesis protein CcsA [Rasiella rasia]|uniref:Cytochrome c biogenesis protein CcsA n=1 Tax=Rasiella rasia TaxID=2744027 RepID=A0A6G6GK83_9FLAO|nr:cytochrome c biogenesis protein CcsA [Rasiella rasia]QIE58958.1 cytochrome c biogenesis protein CcsA [Rasiella rasia]
MQKKLAAFLFSTRLTAVLFIVFAVAMAVGTFLDASSETSPTPYSREIIYNAWWFEAIMVFFVINFCGNIFRFRLYKKEKWATLILHLSFILILVGAFVTRYIGYEGRMEIREGATENKFLSDNTFVTAFVDGDFVVDGVQQRRVIPAQEVRFSERLDNNFSMHTDYNGVPVSITLKSFIKNAKESLIAEVDGEGYLKIVESSGGEKHDHWLQIGQVANIHNILFALNNPTEGAINITYNETDGSYSIVAPFEGSFLNMAELSAAGIQPGQASANMEQFQRRFIKDSVQTLMLRSLYNIADMQFVIPSPVTVGRQGVVRAEASEQTNADGLILDVTAGGETKTVELLGGVGNAPDPTKVTVNGLDVYITYGSKEYELPFSITLRDFIAEKYPGTERNYKSFKSKLTVSDSETEFFDTEVFMNNVLDHKGYRFFQASFNPDEKGTILSVNHDAWGTWITYIGYFLLYFGLMAILFVKGSRFGSLKRMLDKVKAKKAALTIVFALIAFAGQAQTNAHEHTEAKAEQIDSIIKANIVDKQHAAKFSELIIQDNGRMKPVHTYASQLLRKISRSNTYAGMDANQVFISMTEFPRLWVEVPLVSLKRGNDSIRQVLDVPVATKKITLLDLFDEKGTNKLDPYLEKATSKNNPNQFEKDFIKVYENVFLLNEALSGSILKIFPIPNDPGNKWVSYLELGEANFTGKDSMAVRTILPAYFQSLATARKTGDYTQADELLEGIKKFQRTYGASVIPSENKIKAEIVYNKVDIFNRLYMYFTVMGVLMFVFIIFQIFKEGKRVNTLIKACKYVIWTFFALMTLGLIARWYVSGHAPWSDAYESIIYVAWATVFFGLAFGRKSDLTIASTAFVAAIILWVANQNWLDPSISNLVPVLDSYWLMIHVAVIVASYGPFTLGMILGTTILLLILLTTKENKKKMDLNIKELIIITEMALTVGLVMLTIGNFLGGQWANESWGRYWGWDPKETWALISIMIYAFVIHARLVPGLRGKWTFAVFSIFAYASIMMTYFGVNFYLTGLHSYASGDVPVTPTFIYYLIGFFVVLSVVSFIKYKKYYTNKIG